MSSTLFLASASELVTLGNTFSVSGTPTDPTTVSLVVTDPTGTATTYTYAGGDITKTGTGVYTINVAVPTAGEWQYVWTGTGTASDVTGGTWTVHSTSLGRLYAGLAELKNMLRISDSDTSDDAELQGKLASASKRVNDDTGRRFWMDAAVSTRLYRAFHSELLVVDDIATTTGLVVELGRSSTWSTVDSTAYDTLPENAIVNGKAIETLVRVGGCWPTWGTTRVRVTARWGWPAVPDGIREATLLLAGRLFRRKDSLEGVKGFNDLGVVRVSRYDPDYDALISPYVKDVH